MQKASEILNNNYNFASLRRNNDINDNINKFNIVNNEQIGKYSIYSTSFTPNTENTLLAEEIAQFLNDMNNYACFLGVVNRIGASNARLLFAEVKSDIKEKANTSHPVRKPAAYFMWLLKQRF